MAKKKKEWSEEELILTFGLTRVLNGYSLLENWLAVDVPQLMAHEEKDFEELLSLANEGADFWNEETLKMRFISPLLHNFIKLYSKEKGYGGFFDKEISATVEAIYLQTKTDFMLAKGFGDIAQTPYFHFQEYKRSKKSPPEPMAQLLVAFLISQEKNKNGKPLYGLTIVGRNWQFVVMEGKQYGVSRVFDATQKEDLLKIIAILRKFKVILETTLLD
ncbi:MAG: hypothetical protein EAZ55_03425 [Cytophagales bacterium]|nr:MAG: hypothetical protein EAZ55_03425 [Cytophagales bacterium]